MCMEEKVVLEMWVQIVLELVLIVPMLVMDAKTRATIALEIIMVLVQEMVLTQVQVLVQEMVLAQVQVMAQVLVAEQTLESEMIMTVIPELFVYN